MNERIYKYREEENDNSKDMPHDINLMRDIFSAFFKQKHYQILSKRKEVIDEICDVIFGYTQNLHPAMVHQSYTPAILKELNNLIKHNFFPDIIALNLYKGAFIKLTSDHVPYLNDGLIKKMLELDLAVFKKSELIIKDESLKYNDIPFFNETNIFDFDFFNVGEYVNRSNLVVGGVFFVKTKHELMISYHNVLDHVFRILIDVKDSIDSLSKDSRVTFLKSYRTN